MLTLPDSITSASNNFYSMFQTPLNQCYGITANTHFTEFSKITTIVLFHTWPHFTVSIKYPCVCVWGVSGRWDSLRWHICYLPCHGVQASEDVCLCVCVWMLCTYMCTFSNLYLAIYLSVCSIYSDTPSLELPQGVTTAESPVSPVHILKPFTLSVSCFPIIPAPHVL